MRTILNLDNDVLERARAVAALRKMPLRHVVNEALRAGLVQIAKPGLAAPYRTKPRAMGLLPGRSLDNIQELLAQIEGAAFR